MANRSNSRIKWRFVFVAISFYGFILNHGIKNILSVTIVAMSDPDTNNTSSSGLTTTLMSSSNDTNSNKLNWSHDTRNTVLQAFFYGYTASQLPAGRIAEIFGSKHIFGTGVFTASMLSFAFPFAARWSVTAAFIVRLFQGLCLGVTFPAMHSMYARWAPIKERSIVGSFIYSGGPIGIVFSGTLAGYLSGTDFLGGWPAIYYILGASGVIWYILWLTLVYESPEDHPWINEREVALINLGRAKTKDSKAPSLPIEDLLTSLPLFAAIVSQFSYTWGLYVVATQEPTYLAEILNMKIESNGLLSSLPHLSAAICSMLFGVICDRIRRSGRFSITCLRKFFTAIGAFGPAICFIIIPSLGTDRVKVVVLFIVAISLGAATLAGSSIVHVEMAPTFAGTLMGITNCFSNMPGVLIQSAVKEFVGEDETLKNWSKVFYLTAGIYALGGLAFVLFASARLQTWDPEYSRQKQIVHCREPTYGTTDSTDGHTSSEPEI
ncbi:sialin [Tetranychus urticae]|uniref:Major facilitator superfamily (MFS) profile domain-containing protein n=1 Tax=Tetranychus urticae TaxID=32264 RepID=T1L1N4_TETUR|nr:sialin [Tetranychus urticae]